MSAEQMREVEFSLWFGRALALGPRRFVERLDINGREIAIGDYVRPTVASCEEEEGKITGTGGRNLIEVNGCRSAAFLWEWTGRSEIKRVAPAAPAEIEHV